MYFSFSHEGKSWRSLVYPANMDKANLPFLNAATFQGYLGEHAVIVSGLTMAFAALYVMRISRLYALL